MVCEVFPLKSKVRDVSVKERAKKGFTLPTTSPFSQQTPQLKCNNVFYCRRLRAPFALDSKKERRQKLYVLRTLRPLFIYPGLKWKFPTRQQRSVFCFAELQRAPRLEIQPLIASLFCARAITTLRHWWVLKRIFRINWLFISVSERH